MPLSAIMPLLLLAGQAAPAPAAVVTPGCQGEGCFHKGKWVAERDMPLFARPGSTKQVGWVRKGMRVTALGGVIRTTRVGTGMTLEAARHLPADGSGTSLVPLPKGARIRTLYYEGEGIVIAIAPGDRRIGIEQGSFRELQHYRATDWVRLRLPGGRTGWSNRRVDFACSSHSDLSEACR
jgi:hypothetical protein